MAFVNEPMEPGGVSELPNLTPIDFEHGRCVDAHGDLGVAYYATRRIARGEELTVCYGKDFECDDYESVCSNVPLLRAWTERNRRLLFSILRATAEKEELR